MINRLNFFSLLQHAYEKLEPLAFLEQGPKVQHMLWAIDHTCSSLYVEIWRVERLGHGTLYTERLFLWIDRRIASATKQLNNFKVFRFDVPFQPFRRLS